MSVMNRLRIAIVAGVAVVALGVVAAGTLLAAGCSGMSMSCCAATDGSGGMHQHAAAVDSKTATVVPSDIINTKCPIMGGAIDPAKVPASLTRPYKGKTVAFCCPMCLPAWDKLTDAEKDAKLEVVTKDAPKP